MTHPASLPNFDRLQDALSVLSSALGNASTAETIAHGYPLQSGHLTVTSIGDAAIRAGLNLAPANGAEFKPFHCPLLFCNAAGQAIIIAEITASGHGLALAQTGQTHTLSLPALQRAGFTACWLVQPCNTRDERVAHEGDEVKRHWIADALWMNKSIVGSVITATVFTNILALVTPLIMMNVMDRVVSHAAFETLWAMALGGLLAIIFDFALRTLRGMLIDKASASGDVIVNNRIFSKVLGTKLSARQGSVGVQSNTLREFESLREMSNAATVATLGDLPFAILFIAVIAMVSGWLVAVPIAMIPILFACGLFTQKKLNKLVAEHFKDVAHKNAVAVEMLANMETIKAHVGEGWAAAKWERAVASHLRHSLAMRFWMALSANSMSALQSLTTIVLLIMGVYLISAGLMSSGALFATIMLTGRALTPIAQIAALLTKFHHAKTAYKSLRHLVDAEQERPDDAHFLKNDARFSTISLDKVGFSYRKDGDPTLNGITLSIGAGERIGIIGGIGSGKSTLLRILTALRTPTTGSFTIDGLPVQQIDPAVFRRRLGTSFREEGFFFGTIRENLCFHRPEATDDDMIEAARMAGALDWIKMLPSAFDTRLGEAGAGLSTGQRQTLSLARAFIGYPDIIILDEPTSDLDSRTEGLFVSRLRNLPAHQTLIAVTHRPAVIDACTRLLVIDSGSIIMDGSKDIVLAQLRGAVDSNRTAKAA
jgi:ATP-binding cassette, subfamily C, bacterial LapB